MRFTASPKKTLSVEPSGVPVILINTQIINPPGPVLVSTHGKATKKTKKKKKIYVILEKRERKKKKERKK